MCGITGIVNFNYQHIDKNELVKMNSFLKERGPDDEGYLIQKGIGLAHKRLSIVDLSPLGRQPMKDINQDCVVSFNGEIYNFKEIKEELLKAGAKFKSNSDTEVLLEGYLLWGIEVLLQKIAGMFAFVLYDSRNQIAFACRDRFGKKPLYYFYNNDYLKFSSDIRSISKTENGLTLDYESIDYYLTELSVPQPKTIWQEIKQVSPAHYLTINLQNKTVAESKYWSLNYNQKLDISLAEAEELVEKELTEAVVRRIHGDVPIGSFLSSGVDSGLVTALLAINSKEKIKTFTVGLSYEKYNEAVLARKLAERYDTDHTEIIIEPKDLVKVIDRLIDYCGEPFADSSLIPSYYICQSISASVKVALSGDGGDEFFGGYFDYGYAYRADNYLQATANQSVIRQTIGLNLNKICYRFGLSRENKGIAADYVNFSGSERLYRQMGFSETEKESLYSEKFKSLIKQFTSRYLQQIWNNANKFSLTDTLMEASLKTRLLNDYLVKVDRASMINSLEVRSPFLDHKLAEAAIQIPNNIHLHNGSTKYLTKKLAQKYVDKDILSRPKKGFGIPLAEWIRKDLFEHIRDVVYNFKLVEKEIIKKNFVPSILEQHRLGKTDSTDKIWALYCLESWLQKNSV
jgi:asparagine synthase (glutamine-hydrolysing)